MAATGAVAAGEGRAPYAQAARQLLRETLLMAARDEVQERPWAEITMAEVAAAAGVSRQTLYKEFGSRDEFAQALVIHEGERFLDAVEASLREHPDDARAAAGAALRTFLETASEDPLVRVLLSDDGSGLLPFVTTQGAPVVEWATNRLTAAIEQGWPRARPAGVRLLAESLVRLAISHVTAPGGSAEETAEQVVELLGPFIDEALGS